MTTRSRRDKDMSDDKAIKKTNQDLHTGGSPEMFSQTPLRRPPVFFSELLQ